MLVLKRNRDTGVHIGRDIRVKVLSIQRQAVKLGIEAPENVQVWRDELVPHLDEQEQADAEKPSAGMKVVLVIEDNPIHARLIRSALCKTRGTMVTVAENAKFALDALGTRATDADEVVHPDLIVLDMGLPDGSGLDVLRTIRSVDELQITPVVMLSCCDDEGIVQQCLQAGANAFVVKSPDYREFQTSVSRIGRFWSDDCFFPKRSNSQGSDRSVLANEPCMARGTEFGTDSVTTVTKRFKLEARERELTWLAWLSEVVTGHRIAVGSNRIVSSSASTTTRTYGTEE